MSARRYVTIIQAPEGYAPPGAPLEDAPSVPQPQLHSVVLASDYDVLRQAVERIAYHEQQEDETAEAMRQIAREAIQAPPERTTWREPTGDEVTWPLPDDHSADHYRAIDDALYHGGEPDDDSGDDMSCPAAGGLPCGADECLKNGCEAERPDHA